LNVLTKKYPFLLPLIDEVLDIVTNKNLYSFLDGFNGYNQIKIHPNIERKEHSSWNGCIHLHGHALWVMQCANNVPTSYHGIYKEFIKDFM
jgi:hypothetical protein